MVWNVYRYSTNKRKMVIYNIFDHGSFYNDVKKDFKECNHKEAFFKKLRDNVFYYFWCKSEHEIIIAPWVGGDKEKDSVKIDIYHQVMLNFDVFADYTWKMLNEDK